MPPIIDRAQPALHFLPHDLNLTVCRGVKFLLPFWLRTQLSIGEVKTENLEILAKHYQDFQQGKSRILIAFRHPSTADPFTMSNLIWRLLPKAAKESGYPLKEPVRSHFLYDRGVALWAGEIVNWLFPKVGGSSIFRGKPDREGLKAARKILTDGDYPLAIAPEGATNDLSELVGPLEPGLAQLGFWAQDDLIKANRPEKVQIIPLSIKYEYMDPPWKEIEGILDGLEADVNLSEPAQPAGVLTDPGLDLLYGRLLRVGAAFLDVVEAFYSKGYGKTFDVKIDESLTPNQQLWQRLSHTLDQILQVSEEFFDMKPKGDFCDRCRKLEQAAWNCIFIENLDSLNSVERGLADWLASEASLRLSHMRLAERVICLGEDYIARKPSADRFAEVLLLVWRISAWLKGESPHKPPSLGLKRTRIVVGEAIPLEGYWNQYKQDRRSARKTVQEVTDVIQQKLDEFLLVD